MTIMEAWLLHFQVTLQYLINQLKEEINSKRNVIVKTSLKTSLAATGSNSIYFQSTQERFFRVDQIFGVIIIMMIIKMTTKF